MSSHVKLFDEQEIQNRIEELAQEISQSISNDFEQLKANHSSSCRGFAELKEAEREADNHNYELQKLFQKISFHQNI